MKVVQTDVPCPNCEKPICNLCAFNGTCQDCGSRLPEKTRKEVARRLQEVT